MLGDPTRDLKPRGVEHQQVRPGWKVWLPGPDTASEPCCDIEVRPGMVAAGGAAAVEEGEHRPGVSECVAESRERQAARQCHLLDRVHERQSTVARAGAAHR